MKYNGKIPIFCIFFIISVHRDFCYEKKLDRSDCIKTHYHYINKMIIPVFILLAINGKKSILKKIITHLTKDKDALFYNPIIKDCIQKMYITQSINPLSTLWINLNEYHFIDDHTLKREFCILILLFYKGICTNLYNKEKKFIITYINSYYENINSKELNELLEVLNIIAQEIRPLLESMIVSKTKTWKEWLKKYGMPIAAACITIIIKIIIYEKKLSASENKLSTAEQLLTLDGEL